MPSHRGLLHPTKLRCRYGWYDVKTNIPLGTDYVIRFDNGIVEFDANPHGHFAELEGLVDAQTNRYSKTVITILFPVCDDVGACADGCRWSNAVVIEILQVGQVDIFTIAIAGKVPEVHPQCPDLPLRA